jgi:hypothetical protein
VLAAWGIDTGGKPVFVAQAPGGTESKSRGWRVLATTRHGTRQLQDLRRSLLDPPTPIRRQNPAAASTPPKMSGPSPNIHHDGTDPPSFTPVWDATDQGVAVARG